MKPDELRAALRTTGLSRRWFLAYAGSIASVAAARRIDAAAPRPRFTSDPFTLGVASGDPTSGGVVLWTRLAPRPLEPAGGLASEACEVTWEVARDEAFSRRVATGTAVADQQLAHSVHVEVDGLEPDRWYWYRFHCGDAVSPTGRTRTFPAAGAMPEHVRFAFASCQHRETGHYAAYRHLAEADHDLVFHLGDYIYEGPTKGPGVVRSHGLAEIHSLDDYRIRHATYKSDPLLQAAHATCPWMVAWDDHEVDNNYAADVSEELGLDPAEFLVRRAAAYQAYYESMPLRRACLPRGPHMRLHRAAAFGDLAGFFVLDTRQYRGDQPHGDGKRELDAEAFASGRPMLGPEQESWLMQGLEASPARWNLLAQQVMLGMVDRTPGERQLYSMDQWPGYLDARRRLLESIDERQVANPVILTGDIHSNWVNDLRVDDRRPELPVLATEFVGTGISSTPNGITNPAKLARLMAENPSLVWHGGGNGYASCVASADRLETTYHVVEDVAQPESPVTVAARFIIESGRPGAVRA
jgi:alkaline phosphatase D